MQHSDKGEGKRGRWVSIDSLEGGGHAFFSEFDYKDSEIMKTSLNLAGHLVHFLQGKS